jgi:hypothetical protein
MDTNIAVLLLLALDFGTMPHCAPSEIYYSRAFASIRASGIPSVPSQPLSGLELSVLLSLNFAHLREDSAGPREALPRRFRRYAHTPTRSPSVVAAMPRCGLLFENSLRPSVFPSHETAKNQKF